MSKTKYFIKPTIGVNDIKLGQAREEIHQLIGSPESSHENTDYYNQSCLQINYDEQNIAEYIEIYEDVDLVEALISNKNVFLTPKDEIEKFVQDTFNVKTDLEDSEYPYSRIFTDIELSLWSDTESDDFSEDEKAQYPKDFKSSFFFKTVGVGIKGYYSCRDASHLMAKLENYLK